MPSIAQQLADYTAGYGARAFDWNTANCCHFAAGWLRLRTGRDAMEDLPQTPNKATAIRVLRALGGLRRAVTNRSGCRQVIASLAQVGDLVLRELPEGGVALGICAGRTSMHVDEAGAILHLPMDEAVCAWRVEPDQC